LTLVTAGRVGKPHGLDGSFYVDTPQHELPEGLTLTIGDRTHEIARRAGTDERPLIRLAGVDDAGPLRGELLLEVPGLGAVSEVIDAPSCSLLRLTDGTLIPFISDAVRSVDLEAREIRVDPGFAS
jgi:16S rRNA processing protein RimM